MDNLLLMAEKERHHPHKFSLNLLFIMLIRPPPGLTVPEKRKRKKDELRQ